MLLKQASSEQDIKAEINITPLVDIMLVLLIIFIITVPLIRPSQVQLKLPRTGTMAGPAEQDRSVEVALNAQGQLFVDGMPIQDQELTTRLQAAHAKEDDKIKLMIDKSLPYERVSEVMMLLQKSGHHRIAFMLDRP